MWASQTVSSAALPETNLVPSGESAQIVKALGEAGVPAWYILAKDEGHGFRKKSNRDFSNAAMMLFLEKHLFETIDD